MTTLKNMRRIVILIAAAASLSGISVYCAGAAGDISRLYIQLRQQHRLLEIQRRNLLNLQSNSELAAELERPKILPPDEVAPAIMNLSTQMKSYGLLETYIKLERRETSHDGKNITTLSHVAVESTGTYDAALMYLNELTNGDIYYILDKVQLTLQDDESVKLKAVCIIAGHGEAGEALPLPEYAYANPFGGYGNVK